MPERVVSQYQSIIETLRGSRPACLPFVTRLETWYKGRSRMGSMPERFRGMSLAEVHQAVGVGQLKFMAPFTFKLKQVEVICHFNEEPYLRIYEPEVENFPGLWDFISNKKPGETVTCLKTPVGELRLRHEFLEEGFLSATEPYLKEHLIKEENDLKVVEYILENAEFTPQYAKLEKEQAELGSNAFVVPLLLRIPFQQALLEYFGEVQLFYTLHDNPQMLRRLLEMLDLQMKEILYKLQGLNWPYVEFPDNLESMMTNPQLFREYCLGDYQTYIEILHDQGKKVGSHTDGNVKPLLKLLKESGLDVCESFSPYPLTACTFEEAWDAWQGGPLIWGGIPSPILEERTSESEFEEYVDNLFDLVGSQPILLGVVDLMMHHNSIERVEKIARRIGDFPAEVI